MSSKLIKQELQTSNYGKVSQFHIKSWSMPLSYLRDDGHKQVVLITESHGDSNRCTLCRGQPDQHTTHFPRSIHVWPSTIRISHGPHTTTFHTVINRVEQGHCSREKGLPTQSTSRRLTDPGVRTQFLSWANQWSSGGKAKHLLVTSY
jgi:hypothetical protein